MVNDKLNATGELNELENVLITIEEGTLTSDGASIVITDVSGKNYVYGSWYRIDKRINGQWQEEKIIFEGNYGWNDIAYHVDITGNLVLNVPWKNLYGTLDEGYYRIVKSASLPDSLEEKYFSVEFEI